MAEETGYTRTGSPTIQGREGSSTGTSGVVTSGVVTTALGAEEELDKEKPDILESDVVRDESGNIESTTYNPLKNELYNTISCPCSSYAISMDDGSIGCEKDDFGIKKYINPTPINNHLIGSKTPKVGDKWRCVGVKCEQDGFKWDTLHVVSVEKNTGETSTSLFNSISSTSSCYIPPTTLRGYRGNNVFSEPLIVDGVDVRNPEEFVDGKPLFPTEVLAQIYGSINKTGIHTSEYNHDGVIKYIPGEYYPTEKLITGFMVGKENMLAYSVTRDWIYKSYASSKNKIMVKGGGGTIDIKVLGKNNPSFTITIKDSSGCSILDDKIKNITLDSDVYNLKQTFPPLAQGKASETYDITLTPTANSSYYYNNEIIRAGVIKTKIWQYKNPVFTLTASNSTISNATTTQPNVTVSGRPNTLFQKISDLTHTTTITRASGSDNYYIKPNTSFKFSDLTVKSTIIKKIIQKTDEDGIPCVKTFEVTNSQADFDSSNNLLYQGDLEVGMNFTGKVEQTKTVRKSIDLDIHKEPCDDCDEEVDIKTNKFEVDNTNDLFPGMKVVGLDFVTSLESVDCERGITLSSKHVIDKDTNITFSHQDSGSIVEITNGLIKSSTCVRFPDNTVLTFTKGDDSRINGIIKCDKSGASSIAITSIIESANFGQDDTTFTLDPDLFITNKPNAYDQHITIGKESTLTIDFVKYDTDYNRNNKTVTIVKNFSHGNYTLGRSDFAPDANFVGKDKLTFTVTDDNDAVSDEKTIFLTVK